MRTRLLAIVIIAVIALINMMISPVIMVWNNEFVPSSPGGFADDILFFALLVSFAGLIAAIICQIRDNDELFIKLSFVSGTISLVAAVIYGAFVGNGDLSEYLLIFVTGGGSIIVALSAMLDEVNVTIVMSSILVGLLSMMMIPVMPASLIFWDMAFISDTTIDLLSDIGEQSLILILYVIFAVSGLVCAVCGVVSKFKGNDDAFENSLISAGVLTIAATTAFATSVNFDTEYFGSAIYLIFLSGITYLVTGILTKKGTL